MAVVVVTLAMLGLRLLPDDPLRRLERPAYDLAVAHLLPDSADTRAVTVVLVDDESLVRLDERWPMGRDRWADFLDVVTTYGPAVVALDAWFETPSPAAARDLAMDTADRLQLLGLTETPVGALAQRELEAKALELDVDRQLERALAESGRAVLGLVCTARASDVLDRGLAEGILAFDLPTAIAQVDDPLICPTLLASLPRLAVAARAQGVLSIEEDEDGVIRRAPLWVAADGKTYPGLALAALQVARPEAVADLLTRTVTEHGAAPLLWQLPRDRFRTVRFSDVLEAPPGTPALAEALADRIVFVGVSAGGTEDFVRTSLGGGLPGVYVHANLALDLLEGRGIVASGGAVRAGVGAGALLMIGLALLGRRVGGAAGIVALGGGALVAWTAVCALALRSGVLLPAFAVWAGAGLWTVTRLVYAYLRGVDARQRANDIRSAFGLYLAGPVIETLIADPERLKPGGERREITAFFADLKGFTALSEALEPGELVALLNECLGQLTDVILEEGGIIDKYIGDAIVAMFGAPLEQPDHAERACRAALRCQVVMAGLRARFEAEGRPSLHLRIGLNTGPALVGNMGSTQRLDYTMLGDTVNLAARLEGANNVYGTGILVGEETAAHIGGAGVLREVDAIRVKGRQRPVRVYTIVDAQHAATDAGKAQLETAAAGLAAWRSRDWEGVRRHFGALAAQGDPIARTFLERLDRFGDQLPEEGWDGVTTMTTK